jgi:hypothetical protein
MMIKAFTSAREQYAASATKAHTANNSGLEEHVHNRVFHDMRRLQQTP